MVNEKWTVNQEWIQSKTVKDLTHRCYAGISGLVILAPQISEQVNNLYPTILKI